MLSFAVSGSRFLSLRSTQPDSNRTHHPDAMFKSTQSWLSTRTTFDYPSKWVLDVPSADIHLNIDVSPLPQTCSLSSCSLCQAAFEDQEFVTLISRPAFWEGRMNVTGTIKGKPVKGLAFLERHGFENLASLDRFYKKGNVCWLLHLQKFIASRLHVHSQQDGAQ